MNQMPWGLEGTRWTRYRISVYLKSSNNLFSVQVLHFRLRLVPTRDTSSTGWISVFVVSGTVICGFWAILCCR